ncbi:MAG TPA: hypothetical protein VIV60_09355, partial [Polyangiaceae bacterium]
EPGNETLRPLGRCSRALDIAFEAEDIDPRRHAVTRAIPCPVQTPRFERVIPPNMAWFRLTQRYVVPKVQAT